MDGAYDCNICLELAQDPVVTMCGHLYCWPCLYRWMCSSRSSSHECPVCKSAVETSRVVPIYGRGKGATDPRSRPVAVDDEQQQQQPQAEEGEPHAVPARPAGRRTEPPPRHAAAAGGGVDGVPHIHPFGLGLFSGPVAGGSVTLSAGMGLFPFLFGFWSLPVAVMTPSASGGAAAGEQPGQPAVDQGDAFLSRILMFLAVFVIVCLLFF